MTHQEKLASIRVLMEEHTLDAYIVPSSDPHINEYLPDRFKCLEYLSGFTGSAGTLVITRDFAGLWTDSRYFVQAKEQLNGTGFELVKLQTQGSPEYMDWLDERLDAGSTIAFDGKLMSVALAKELVNRFQSKRILINGSVDLPEEIWENRPLLPQSPAYLLNEKTVGESTEKKIKRIRYVFGKKGATHHLVSSLDDIAWIFNIRGSDIKCNPLVLSYAFFTPEETLLFLDLSKIEEASIKTLRKQGVTLKGYNELYDVLDTLPSGACVLIDPKKTCYSTYLHIPQYERLLELSNPSTLMKAIKNKAEVKNMRETMIKDGLAMTRFFRWLEMNKNKELITELSLTQRLLEFRKEQPGFVNESFDTIAGYRSHGALPHYKATEESNSVVKPTGLLLVDSGGQYLSGTTDITRVVSLGDIKDEEQIDYTLVLTGMIEGSTARYPKGTRGYQIDAITRRPLWNQSRNYGHGTGHGIGFFLNVHEGPQVLNSANVDVALEEGMISSIEPGLYREGQYGIRIENLVLSTAADTTDFGEFLKFETLTLCYIDTSLIKKELLELKHIDWLNRYHQQVYEQLSPYLNEEESIWLAGKTQKI